MVKTSSTLFHAAASPLNTSLAPMANVVPTARRLSAGSYLFRQGDKCFGIFRLVFGGISLVRVTPNGAEVPMHRVSPGDLFAEASLFSATYHCDAVALAESEVLIYPKEALTRQFKASTEDLWTFTAELAQRVQGMRTRLQVRQIRSAPDRVLQSLRLRCDSSGVWTIDGTLKRFAEELGLTHETLYRTLARLERDGLITREENLIALVLAAR